MSWQTDADNAVLVTLLGTFDHQPVWDQAKPPHATKTVVGHKRNFGSAETEHVNAYGVSGVEIIVAASDFASAPEKFDTFDVGGEKYTVVDVIPQRGFNNTVIIYRCYSRGK